MVGGESRLHQQPVAVEYARPFRDHPWGSRSKPSCLTLDIFPKVTVGGFGGCPGGMGSRKAATDFRLLDLEKIKKGEPNYGRRPVGLRWAADNDLSAGLDGHQVGKATAS